MTFAEFRLREYAYKREQQWDWAKHRLTGFMAIRAFNVDSKNIPKTLEDIIHLPFVDNDKEKGGLNERQIAAFKKAQQKYELERKLKEIE